MIFAVKQLAEKVLWHSHFWLCASARITLAPKSFEADFLASRRVGERRLRGER